MQIRTARNYNANAAFGEAMRALKSRGVPVYCKEYKCFAWSDGKCNALSECLAPDCPFFKTREQVGQEARKAMARLAALGHDVKVEYPVLYYQATKF